VTNVEKLTMQMQFDDDSRRRLALEFLKLRRIEAEARRHQRRLPHQVQTALRVEPTEYDIDAPAIGAPDLFAAGRNA